MTGYRIFGITVASSLDFPGEWQETAGTEDATILSVDDLLPLPGGRGRPGWSGVSDGMRFEVVCTDSGDYLFLHGDVPLFALSTDLRMLTCAPPAARSVTWWRILLDSVLFTVSLLRGNEALHAGAVATPAGAVAIVSGSGGGKSTLLHQLLSSGAELVTDDILFVDAVDGRILAHPGAPLMTLPRHLAAGCVLGHVGEETWVTVPVVPDALPLRRIVLLSRRADVATAMVPVDNPLTPLMRHLLNYPRTPERELARFSLASTIAAEVEIWRLVSDVGTPPDQLAALALRGLGQPDQDLEAGADWTPSSEARSGPRDDS